MGEAMSKLRSMIEIKNLSVNFGKVKAIDNVSLDIADGEVLGLVGESGSGKTTLGRAILGLIRPGSGQVKFRGADVHQLRGDELKKMRSLAQIVFQNPYSSLNPKMKISTMIEEPLVIHQKWDKNKRIGRVNELLNLVGLSADFMNRFPHELSGGERQKVGIARALAVNPKFIVCDEPVSSLDVSVQAQILNLLKDLKKKLKLTYLFITHELAVVSYMADRVAVMQKGRIVEIGDKKKIFRNPTNEYTIKLIDSTPKIKY
ncbi:MAG: ATP-binding cassette domain-containing protein [bacterium]